MPAAADTRLAQDWLGRLGHALIAGDASAAAAAFGEDCYWRDLVSLTWNIRTMDNLMMDNSGKDWGKPFYPVVT